MGETDPLALVEERRGVVVAATAGGGGRRLSSSRGGQYRPSHALLGSREGGDGIGGGGGRWGSMLTPRALLGHMGPVEGGWHPRPRPRICVSAVGGGAGW